MPLKPGWRRPQRRYDIKWLFPGTGLRHSQEQPLYGLCKYETELRLRYRYEKSSLYRGFFTRKFVVTLRNFIQWLIDQTTFLLVPGSWSIEIRTEKRHIRRRAFHRVFSGALLRGPWRAAFPRARRPPYQRRHWEANAGFCSAPPSATESCGRRRARQWL